MSTEAPQSRCHIPNAAAGGEAQVSSSRTISPTSNYSDIRSKILTLFGMMGVPDKLYLRLCQG
jgi:hypothetical protein